MPAHGHFAHARKGDQDRSQGGQETRTLLPGETYHWILRVGHLLDSRSRRERHPMAKVLIGVDACGRERTASLCDFDNLKFE